MSFPKYKDIVVEVSGGVGVVKVGLYVAHLCLIIAKVRQFNRPKSLNAFGGNMIPETIDALRILNDHPDTTFTVLTGEGRFFSAGADVRGMSLAFTFIDPLAHLSFLQIKADHVSQKAVSTHYKSSTQRQRKNCISSPSFP